MSIISLLEGTKEFSVYSLTRRIRVFLSFGSFTASDSTSTSVSVIGLRTGDRLPFLRKTLNSLPSRDTNSFSTERWEGLRAWVGEGDACQ